MKSGGTKTKNNPRAKYLTPVVKDVAPPAKVKRNWHINILFTIANMISPQESVVKLKLWRVSKAFYRVTKEVIPYQLTDGQIRVIEL